MRGISDESDENLVNLRFNPAYAGNIGRNQRAVRKRQVQPRVCGEYDTDATQTDVPTGSTPRMRGI